MTRDMMTEMLSETICVNTEQARAALEASDWDLLTAGRRLLQAQEDMARLSESVPTCLPDGGRTFAEAVRSLIARAGRSRFTAQRDDLPELTAATLAPLMLMPSVYACHC